MEYLDSPGEIEAFLVIQISMGLTEEGEKKMFARVMMGNRFQLLSSGLHFTNMLFVK